MSNEPKTKRCTDLKHPNIQPGWGCCNCRTYNGEQREACKVCQHKRCDKNIHNQVS